MGFFNWFNSKPKDTEKELEALRERNEARIAKAIEELGIKYLCHPDNQLKKLSKRQQKRISSYSYN